MSKLSQILCEIELLAKKAKIIDLQVTITGYRLLAIIKEQANAGNN